MLINFPLFKIPIATSIEHNITLNLNIFMKPYCHATNAHFWPVDSWSQGQVELQTDHKCSTLLHFS